MGAFTLFVLSNPPIHRWFQIAFMTWFEPDSTVASFIYSSFSAMSKFETSVPLLTDLKEKSTAALFLSKPTFDPQNANRIWSQYLRHEKLGAYIRSELFSGGKKPTNLYARFNWNIGPFDFDAIEIETSFIGDMEDFLLNLSNPKNGNKEIYVHATLMESIESVFSTSFQDVGKFFRGPKNLKQWFAFQPLVDFTIAFPNDLGILTKFQIAANMMVYVDDLNMDMEISKTSLEGNFDATVGINTKAVSKIGFLFGKKSLKAGSQIKGSFQTDFSGAAIFDLDRGNANFQLQKFNGKIQLHEKPLSSASLLKSSAVKKALQAEEFSSEAFGLGLGTRVSGRNFLELFEKVTSQASFGIFSSDNLNPLSLEEGSLSLFWKLRKTLSITSAAGKSNKIGNETQVMVGFLTEGTLFLLDGLLQVVEDMCAIN
ncbi:uncharacterized protein LOC136034934 isoform X2 [Artemia franciscana]|uniref:uncharacterized protein LOC136034934 isoform X2 n=1 Tax=Artemia franciscana TaxID=6661 RepID=UPI0032DB1157